ncbi:squalene/phytoene synthase family protein [Rhizorhabdus phycosphaerae]|uniref:squalene/phytoene synthase family protein n=1 Tax=Rhizorhabdus phycosphaerae TaxID=2711156 RepID=UPI001D0140AF|nr:squalene/phytoene synthase family protein [Rhizorhabdus phycosphaerae]
MRSSAISTAASTTTSEPPLLADPERMLALSYAAAARKPALAALWQLDERMGAIVAAARDPLIGSMRLVWWRDALADLDDRSARVPAEPLLQALSAATLTAGVTGSDLAALEEGWSVLLDEDTPNVAQIETHGTGRGAPLFRMAATLLGQVPDDIEAAGAGWALADLGHRLQSPEARRTARAAASRHLAQVDLRAWPRSLRPLGLLTLLARADAALPADRLRRQGSPKRLFRSLAYGLLGR